MGALVAVEAAELVFDDGMEEPVAPVVLKGMGVPGVKAGGSPVLNEKLSIVVESFQPGETDTSVGVPVPPTPFTFVGSGSKTVKAGGLGVLREGDESAPVQVTWANNPDSGVPSRVAVVVCKIKSAGQGEVSAG